LLLVMVILVVTAVMHQTKTLTGFIWFHRCGVKVCSCNSLSPPSQPAFWGWTVTRACFRR
jgi:hypothetical protein